MSKEQKKSPIDSLIDAIEKANVKITFGLQPYHIDKIETELKRWYDMPPLKSFPDTKVDMKFAKHVWDKLGKELGWCPFTLALHYFEYLENKK